jgi:hypothetical protein
MTGKQKIMDTAGRVERFKKRYAPKAEIPKTAKIEKTETTAKKTTKKASA